jgi:glutaredoxin-related protein
MKSIVIAFTLKGQNFEKIEAELKQLSDRLNTTSGEDPVLVIHGFMPRSKVMEKGFSTSVVDALDKLFPHQLNMYSCVTNMPLRKQMAHVALMLNATIYVIGDIAEGVAEEVQIYQSAEMNIIHKPIAAN